MYFPILGVLFLPIFLLPDLPGCGRSPSRRSVEASKRRSVEASSAKRSTGTRKSLNRKSGNEILNLLRDHARDHGTLMHARISFLGNKTKASRKGSTIYRPRSFNGDAERISRTSCPSRAMRFKIRSHKIAKFHHATRRSTTRKMKKADL